MADIVVLVQLDDWVLCRIYKKSKCALSSTGETEATVGVGDVDQAEEHQFKDTLFPISKGSTPSPPHQNTNTLMTQKSVSFSNLLDAMDYSMLSSFLSSENQHSNPTSGIIGSNALDQQSSPIINTSNNNNSSCYMFHQKNSTQLNPSSVSNMENNNNIRLKRQLSNIDEDNTLLYPSKKYLKSSSCNFPNNINAQFESPQWNYLMKQSLLNQQLLLGPHLQFQG